MRSHLCALLLVLFAPGCIIASHLSETPASEAVKELRDVAYHQGEDFDDAKHRLDLYIPTSGGSHPTVVFVHGGGWWFGDRSYGGGAYVKLGRRLAQRGILTAVISYRLAPTHKHPAHVRDVARAVAWAQKHAAEHGGDPQRLFLLGHSAGAQLAALVACDHRWLEELSADPTAIAGVIAISGPYDVRKLGASLVGGLPLVIPAFGRDPAVWEDASPASHLRTRPPPFLVAVGEVDPGLLHRQAIAFRSALARAGGTVASYEAPYKTHFTVIMDLAEPGDLLGEEVIRFIHAHRAEPRPTVAPQAATSEATP